MLVLTRRLDQEIFLTVGGERVVIAVLKIDRGQVRLGFDASRSVVITRSELAEREAEETPCDAKE